MKYSNKRLLPNQMRIIILDDKDRVLSDDTIIHIVNGVSVEKDIKIELKYKQKISNAVYYQIETWAYGLVPKRIVDSFVMRKGDSVTIHFEHFRIS